MTAARRLTDLSEDDLLPPASIGPTLASPDYVRRAGVLTDVECFDAAFFGITPREAAILMDPQHRIFYECAWEALEEAGHDPRRFDGSIGVFAGCGHEHLPAPQPARPARACSTALGWFLLRHTGNDKDFLTHAASRTGSTCAGRASTCRRRARRRWSPCTSPARACWRCECDLALAGGVTDRGARTPPGYQYHEGEILSPDGHCRAFDADAGRHRPRQRRRRRRAQAAGRRRGRRRSDLAVIRGSAVNNDGSRKVGYTRAQRRRPGGGRRRGPGRGRRRPGDDRRYVEAHGTGTRVGDPIEVAALTAAFRDGTDAPGSAALGSVKPNIGHLDTAAGVAGLIKVVLALRHRGSRRWRATPRRAILLDLKATPFVLSGDGEAWEPARHPRRAGVSSLGVGGTNAHVVVEEAPAPTPSDPAPGPHLLLVSARTDAAADAAAERLADHLDDVGDDALGDSAHTLRTGRRAFAHRRAVSARSAAEAAHRLRGPDRTRLARAEATDGPLDVVLCFPGGGSQYAGMGGGLLVADQRFAVYREVLEEALSATQAASGPDLCALLLAAGDRTATTSAPPPCATRARRCRRCSPSRWRWRGN